MQNCFTESIEEISPLLISSLFIFRVAQLKTINLTESACESNLRSKDTKPRKRGCFQPDD
jgi:hypothetical protein